MPLDVSSTLVLVIKRSKLYYTASGVITLVDGRPVHKLRAEPSFDLCTWSTYCSKHVEAYNKLTINQDFVH